MPTALATVTDVEDIAGPVPSASHDRIDRLIAKVSAMVRRYTGQTFDAVEGDVVTIRPRNGYLRLPQRPVTAVTSVTIDATALDPAGYAFTVNGNLSLVNPTLWDLATQGSVEWLWPPVPVTVTYDHGYAEPPLDLSMVVAERVATMWRFGVDGTAAEAIDGYSAHYQRPTGGAWTPEHKMVLDSYRRSGAASLRLSQ